MCLWCVLSFSLGELWWLLRAPQHSFITNVWMCCTSYMFYSWHYIGAQLLCNSWFLHDWFQEWTSLHLGKEAHPSFHGQCLVVCSSVFDLRSGSCACCVWGASAGVPSVHCRVIHVPCGLQWHWLRLWGRQPIFWIPHCIFENSGKIAKKRCCMWRHRLVMIWGVFCCCGFFEQRSECW